MFLSAIVPAYHEEACIEDAVRCCGAVADEVIVSDGGSADATVSRAAGAGARVVTGAKGRGPQLNRGARIARGDVLLFVHADTWLPQAARGAIDAALSDRSVVGGNFKLRFVPPSVSARVFGLANHLRRRHLRLYYGDSCIFLRRSVFEKLNGFPDIPVMEDYALVRRLEKAGRTHYETAVAAETSARRFEGRVVRTLLVWGMIQGLYAAGVSPHRLARLYRDLRSMSRRAPPARRSADRAFAASGPGRETGTSR
ncbi:MAG: TIGR04283 family arsenosugar biosynthesis glycosyltransferase [Myxococcota bacterium]